MFRKLMLFGLFVFLLVGIAIGLDTGATSPGTVEVDAGTYHWSNKDNIKASDNAYASCSERSGDYIIASNFGFSIPEGNVIDGVKVSIERKADINDPGGDGAVDDEYLYLQKAGTPGGDNKAAADNWWTISDTTADYGGDSDLWGLTLSESDVENSGFGVRLQLGSGGGDQAASGLVDHITMTVYYSEGVSTPQLNITSISKTSKLIIKKGGMLTISK